MNWQWMPYVIPVVVAVALILTHRALPALLKRRRAHGGAASQHCSEEQTADLIAANRQLQQEIDRRVQAEEALRESELKHRLLLQSIQSPVLALEDGKGRMIILYCNEAYGRFVGRPTSELEGQELLKLFPEFEHTRSYTAYLDVFRTGKPQEVEGEFRGRHLQMQVYPTPWGVLALAQDVTERRRAEEEIRQRTAQLEALRQVDLELATELDLNTLLHSIVSRAVQLVSATAGGLCLYRAEEDRLEWAVSVGSDLTLAGSSMPCGQRLAERVRESGQPLIVEDYRHWEGRNATHDTCFWTAVMGVPVHWKEELLGVLVVLTDAPRTFQPAGAELLNLFAAEAAIAIHNAELYEQAQRRAEQLAVVNRIARAASATLQLDDLVEIVYREITSTFEADAFFIALYDQESSELDFRLKVDEGVRERPLRQRLESGLTDLVIVGKKPLLVRDLEKEQAHLPPLKRWGTMKVAASWLGVPMQVGERVVGVISVQTYHPHAYGNEEELLLATIGDQVAIAVDNARLYAEQRRRAEEAHILLEIGNAVNSALELREMLRKVTMLAAHACEADRCTIFMLDKQGQALIPVMSQFASGLTDRKLWRLFRNLSIPHPVLEMPEVAQVLRERCPLFLADAQASTLPSQWTEPFGPHSVLIVPLTSREQVVGLMVMDRCEAGRVFSPEATRLAMTIGAQVATAIEKARLYRETALHLARTQVLRELMLAASSTLNFDMVLQRTCETLRTQMQVEFLSVVLPTPEGDALAPHPSLIGYSIDAASLRLSLDGSVCGHVFQSGEPALVGDVRQVPYYYPGDSTVRSEVSVPVLVGGCVIGVLNVESKRLHAFDEDDLAFYVAIAGQLGVALTNAHLYQAMCERAEQLSGALGQLQELDRLKSEFIQNVSHELRSPLALIRGYAELLADGSLGTLSAEQQGPTEIIARRARMLGSLVDDITLILLTEARTMEQETVTIGDVVRATAEDFRVAAYQAQLALQVDIAPDLPPVHGAPLSLRRVLDNLLGNAVKFTPAGGTIRVQALEQDGHVVLTVSDTGIGIPPEEQERIFERFYQINGSTRRRYGGVGLGLALVKEIIRAHKGTVSVSSEPGQGSTFTVRLPTTQKP